MKQASALLGRSTPPTDPNLSGTTVHGGSAGGGLTSPVEVAAGRGGAHDPSIPIVEGTPELPNQLDRRPSSVEETTDRGAARAGSRKAIR